MDLILLFSLFFFFFFKQKTAYEMRISDWIQTCALPIFSELTNLAYWRIKNLLTGAGTECFKALVDLQKQHKKLTKLQKKLDEGEEAALEMAKTNVKELFSAHIDAMKTGGELDDLLNYDSRSEERRAGNECVSTCRSRW